MAQQEISKFEIAKTQLIHAMELYIDGQYPISVITLAGAAEEIFRKLVEDKGGKPAINHDLEMYEDILKAWATTTGEGPTDQRIATREAWNLTFDAKKDMKHFRSGKAGSHDLDYEAHRYLSAAIKDFNRLPGGSDIGYLQQIESVERAFLQRHGSIPL